MHVLLGENTIECNIYEILVCRYCMSKKIIFFIVDIYFTQLTQQFLNLERGNIYMNQYKL